MLNIYTYLGYCTLNLIISIVVLSKTKRNLANYYYLLSIIYLTVFGGLGSLYCLVESEVYRHSVQHLLNFIYAIFPFIFLHFIINFVGYSHIIKNKFSVPLIYITGIFSYSMMAVGVIDGPFSSAVGIAQSGTIFFITWMSIYFAIGIVQLIAIFGNSPSQNVKSNLLFSGFLLLLLILPGPFAESIFQSVIGDYNKWYFISSIGALIIAVYIVFRYKSSVNLLEALKTTLGLMDDVILQTDESYKIILAQGAVNKIFGTDEKSIQGKYLTKYLSETNFLKKYFNLSEKEKISTTVFDTVLINENGEQIFLNFSITPLEFNETITGYILIGRDITSRKELEHELLELNQRLEKDVAERTKELALVNKELQKDIEIRKITEEDLRIKSEALNESLASKNKMFSIVAHDLKSPFFSLLGFSEALVNDINELNAEEVKMFAQNIYASSTRIYGLLENLLHWSRIQTNRLIVTPENFTIKDLILQVERLYQDNLDRKNISICNEVEKKISVFADKYMIETVLRNLISNAIKFSRINSEIFIKAEIKQEFVEVSIVDNGIGITEDNLERIFKIDDYVSTPDTEEIKGSGIGLILSNEFIQKNGGTISVKSIPKEGSTFSFTLPINQ